MLASKKSLVALENTVTALGKWIQEVADAVEKNENEEQISNETINSRLSKINSLLNDLNGRITRIEQGNLQREEALAKKNNSPWVEVRSVVQETKEDGAVAQIELDWNPSFVKYLRDSGITGLTDEEVIQKYIKMLYTEVSERMHEDSFGEGEGMV